MRSQPNREEQLIIDCLKIQGFENIQPEPDGNVPPDILLDGNIAIEVRRMNQNKISGQGYVGLENDYYTLQFLIQEIIRDIADISFSRSAIVDILMAGRFQKKSLLSVNCLKYLKSIKYV